MRDNKEVLLLWFIGYFNKKIPSSGANNAIKQNEQLDKELHKPVIRKFKKRKVYFLFKDNIWGADLTDMQLTNKLNKRVRFLLCVIDIFSEYACVVTLKDKKGGTIVNAFQNILKISKRKPYKIWRDKAVNFITDQSINEIIARKK